MKLIRLHHIIALNTGIDLAEQQEMEHLLIHSGQVLKKYLCTPGIKQWAQEELWSNWRQTDRKMKPIYRRLATATI